MVWSNEPVTTSALPPISACSARAPPAKIGDLDVEALVLEVAEPLGDRERQIEQRGLAADREPHLGLRAALRGASAASASASAQSPQHAHHASCRPPVGAPYSSSMRAHSS